MAAGLVTGAGTLQAEEAQHAVMTTLQSTTISGYVDTSAIVNFGGGDRVIGRSFDGGPGDPSGNRQDGFNFNVVKLQLEKPLDAGQFSSGYQASVMFGPDANVVGSTSTGIANSVSDFAVRNAYVTLGVPLGNDLDIKLGVWDTVLGYEVVDAGSNAHYSRSFGFFLEPVAHTGVLGTYRISEIIKLSAGVADPSVNVNTVNVRSKEETTFSYLGSISIVLPESTGVLKGAGLTGAVVKHGVADGPDMAHFYLGLNLPIGEALGIGVAYDYRGNSSSDKVSSAYANALSGYLSLKAGQKLKLAGRIEYATSSAGTWSNRYAEPDVDERLLGVTVTLDYKLWANAITRLEGRWDKDLTGTGVFNDGDDINSLSLALNIIYNF